jgi:O-methyltransferase
MGNGRLDVRKLMTFPFRIQSDRKRIVSDSQGGIPAHVQKLIRIVRPYTMVDALRLAMLHQLAQEVPDEGDVVECGVCNGGSAAVLASAIRNHLTKSLWLYDTFEGIPPPTTKDGPDAEKYTGRLVGRVDRVNEVLALVGFPKERIVIRQGLFKDSFRQPLPAKVALLHLDADWYDGILQALETFYPLIPTGGIVILDDFGHWEGTREAFYEFCKRYDLRPLLERVGHTQAFWRKDHTHNRGIQKRFARGLYGLGVEGLKSAE